ncbi:hypothetical protein QWY97_09285 [Vibrio cortegadensis]|uniref:hypothetical protein n=1 Tax=Vibrio cortegadensis TaxID=1328770 RepID=UPI0021C2853A|nr:hypothetical protein [Vibrio cortegadensis]MDN3697544.1 hypothetical protein [Vibrio cortegadensis]
MTFSLPNKEWYASLASLATLILVTLAFDYGWKAGMSLETGNIFGVLVFCTIMASGPISYIGARIAGAVGKQAIKIALLVPFIWHLKEIYNAIEFFGVAEGIYAGLQGWYIFYYCLIFALFGIIELVARVIEKFIQKKNVKVLPAFLYFLPFIIVFGIESYFWTTIGYDPFILMGYLDVYLMLFS